MFRIRCLKKTSPRSSVARGNVRSCPFFTTAMKPSHISSFAPKPQLTCFGGLFGLRGCAELSKCAMTLTIEPAAMGIGFSKK
jgi:hypothetical protein